MREKIKTPNTGSFAKESRDKWPYKRHNIEDEPRFLFIITPPYSGSTALTQIFNSCHGTAFLGKNGEGQWLVPGMCEADRWASKKIIDWESVRSVWLNRIQLIRELVQDVDLIIEKSPPNLVRIDQLIEIFPQHTLLAFNRDPYANCSSILYRNHTLEDMQEAERVKIVSSIAKKWLFRSKWVKKWIDQWQIAYFTYEQFCSDPLACLAQLVDDIPELQTVDVKKSIKVKDYKMQGIINYNAKQISKLHQPEIDAISETLACEPELVSFFGYKILAREG